MKPPMLGLTVATVVFGATSLYFSQQLSAARERAAQVEQTTKKLNARIAELEGARTQFAQQRMGNSGASIAGSLGQVNAPGAAEASDLKIWSNPTRTEMPQAIKKMMRAQMRAHNKRMYADVGESLGLSKDIAARLIDLISDQQAFGLDGMRPDDGSAHQFEDLRSQQDAAIADLIGPEKMQAWTDYQQSMPARQDFEMLARQLESNDVSLTPDQTRQLMAAYVEERSRVPMPQWTEGIDSAEYAKSMAAWQEDYNRRVIDEVSHILNSEQLTAYNEIQQWQQQMRDQFAVAAAESAPAAAHGAPLPRGFSAVTFTSIGEVGAGAPLESSSSPPSVSAAKPRKQ